MASWVGWFSVVLLWMRTGNDPLLKQYYLFLGYCLWYTTSTRVAIAGKNVQMLAGCFNNHHSRMMALCPEHIERFW